MWKESERELSSASVYSGRCDEEPGPMETEEGHSEEVAMSSRRSPAREHGKDTFLRNWYFVARDWGGGGRKRYRMNRWIRDAQKDSHGVHRGWMLGPGLKSQ